MVFLVVGLLLAGVPSFALGQDTALSTPELRQAAFACQKVVTQVTAKVTTARFKALDQCANAALTCVQTKIPIGPCLDKTAIACQRKLASSAVAIVKARTKIGTAKSCLGLRTEDLLGSDGLGFGVLAPLCDADFGLDVCQGIAPLADCLVRTHVRAAGALYARARPRTAELLGLLPGESVLPIAGLAAYPGCANCSVAPAQGKNLTQCGRLLTQATSKLSAALDKSFARCAQGVLACFQAKAQKPGCLTKATDACNGAAGELPEALGNFVASVATGKCRSENVPFDTIADDTGLNFAAVAGACSAAGGGAPDNISELATCLARDARCNAAGLMRQQVPRTAELDAAGHLGALGTASGESCSGAQLGTPSFASSPRAAFGSIRKIVKVIRGATFNQRKPPSSTPGTPRTVTVNGPRRIPFGGITKIPFSVRLSGKRSAGPSRLVLPPTLIITAQGGAPPSDFFELTLPMPASLDDEIQGELEVTYEGQPPSCAINLAFATSADGVVSDYTPLMQVADLTMPSRHEVRLRLSNIDDEAVASLNGQAFPRVFFGAEERVFDATSAFRCGENALEIQVFNGPVGYTHRAVLEVDNVPVVQSSCGTFLGFGCNGDDRTPGLAFDEVNYFCVPCDGKPCDGGTCGNPYVVPDRADANGKIIVKADVSGPSNLPFCGGTGPEKVFRLTPASRACYQMDSCRSIVSQTSMYTSIGGCGPPNEPEDSRCLQDDCGFIDDAILEAGQPRTIVVDALGAVSTPTGVAIEVTNIGASACD